MPGLDAADGRQASGRESHPLKITVYLSADEYLDLERARLSLRSRGIGVDRGRLVREAIAVLLADLDFGVEASVLARRLRQDARSTGDGGATADGVPSVPPVDATSAVLPGDGRPPVPSVGGMPPAPSVGGRFRVPSVDGVPGPAADGLRGSVPPGPQ